MTQPRTRTLGILPVQSKDAKVNQIAVVLTYKNANSAFHGNAANGYYLVLRPEKHDPNTDFVRSTAFSARTVLIKESARFNPKQFESFVVPRATLNAEMAMLERSLGITINQRNLVASAA